ncbi:MAG: helix-turn-helix transcriptional regulator [Hyphomonadaceae bacterium]|nr:helix-turn-helix transcriptional regulator [Hyphomonadaceae bacterium]
MTAPPIGNHLRRMRFDHGQMTQQTLAQAVGVTRQTIVALETGRYAPSLELAMRLAGVFGCGVDDLFFWNGTQPESATRKNQ